jgi:hypothetical protein
MQPGFPKPSKSSLSILALQKREAAMLKRLLQAQRLARLSQAFDQAVPSCYLASAPVRSPIIHLSSSQHLSPYIIRLETAAPAPLREEDAKTVLVNLLTHPVATATHDTLPADDLLLSPSDLSAFSWEQKQQKNVPTPVAPSLGEPVVAVKEHPQTILSFPDPLSYFDLPEDDDPEESELVDFTSLQPVKENLPLPPSSQSFFRIPLPQGWMRTMVAFVLVSFVIVLPIHAMSLVKDIQETKTRVENLGVQGLDSFRQATNALFTLDAKTAKRSFLQAASRFEEAQQSLQQTSLEIALFSALPTTQAHTASSILQAASRLSTAGSLLSQSWSSLEGTWHADLTTRLSMLSTHLQTVLPYLEEAQQFLRGADVGDLPSEHQAFFDQARTQLPALQSSLQSFLSLGDFAREAMGENGTKRYLLLFQNQTELRPTGGFVGSFAEVNVHQGVLENLSVPGGGSYDLQGRMRTSFVAPEPLRLLNARWEFQDANWFADFPTSARHLLAMYKEADGPTVDGVIALNASFVETLLGVLGPVDMPAYGRTITQENFLLETQKIVEEEYDKTLNTPKAFIGDLAEVLLNRLENLEPLAYVSLWQIIESALMQKEIQMYFADEHMQKQAIAYGWSGEVKQTSGDYLMVVDTNLGGGKTDGVIKEEIRLTVRVAQDGTIVNTVEVMRAHQGAPGALFTGVNNVDYLRLYVPKGSTLLSAEGFSIPDERLFEIPNEDWVMSEYLAYAQDTKQTDALSRTDIFEESGKTVFGNWVQTRPGESSTARFTYRLPFLLSDLRTASFSNRLASFLGSSPTTDYTLYLQKQSGASSRQTSVRLELPQAMHMLWSSSSNEETTFSNETDQTFAALLTREP